MATRYAFWRTPTGAAYKGQDNKHAPSRLLAQIGKWATVDAKGRISWKTLWFPSIDQVIVGSVTVIDPDKGELNQYDARSIVGSAIPSLIKKGAGKSAIDPAKFLREVDKRAATFFRKSQAQYRLVTSVSIKPFPAKTILADRCSISPLRTRTRYPVPDSLGQELAGENDRRWSGWSGHQLVRINTLGRSWFDAADRALEALALVCGLWNLVGTYGVRSMSFNSRTRKPLGVVHVGPYHTLHTEGGKSVGDVYWYEPDYAKHREPFTPSRGWPTIENERRWAMRKLRRSPYRRDLRQLIIRYANALSKSDPDVAFLHMWGILESLTNTVGARYEDTVRRATWIYSDDGHAREFLEYLRCYRNQYVHAARSDHQSEQVAQLIKPFLDRHILGLLRNDFRVQSLDEYAACLSLPTSIVELKRHRQRSARAFRLRKSWKTPE